MEDATKFFEEWLHNGNAGSKAGEVKAAQEYVKKRGLTDATVKEFRIGFVPEDWRLLYNHLHSKGWGDIDIEKAGLAKRPDPSDAEIKAGAREEVGWVAEQMLLAAHPRQRQCTTVSAGG